MQCQEICREVVNSPGAVERRELLLSSKPTRTGPPSAAVTGEAPSKMIEERHVHEKAGLRRKIDHQRRNLRELQDRLRHIQMELDARKRRRSGGQTTATTAEQEEVLSEPYRRRIILKELDVSLTGMREAELRVVHEETRRLRALAQEALAETEKDMQSVSRWERFESGFETRDVLANGERRLHMELRYGREVSVKDVEKELHGMTKDQRRTVLMEGIGKDRSDGRLPGPLKLNHVGNLLES